jgi:hypothetical protein
MVTNSNLLAVDRLLDITTQREIQKQANSRGKITTLLISNGFSILPFCVSVFPTH